MAKAKCAVTILTVIMYTTHHIPNTAGASLPSSTHSSNTRVPEDKNPAQACALQVPTEVVQCVLSCAGLGLSSVAMVEVKRRKNLNRPFRVLLSSLTVADLSLSSSSFLLAILALYLSVQQHVQTVVCTVCTILTGTYHSLLICSASTTLALSVDRVMAVFAPVRYRQKKTPPVLLMPWALAALCMLLVPLTWHFLGDLAYVRQANLNCWPLVAVKKEFLIVQGGMLMLSAMGISLAHLSLLYKLTRRAVLVVPMFGTRTSDSTALERLQTRRNVRHASTQACTFLLVYLALAPYFLWLAVGSVRSRVGKACGGDFLVLSQFPMIGTIINSMLTLWRFRIRAPSVTNTAVARSDMEPPLTDHSPARAPSPPPPPPLFPHPRQAPARP